MANDKKFQVKNGLRTQNINFQDNPEATNIITTSMIDDLDALSISGDAGQLFSLTDDLTGSVFTVNDISGMPSIEVLANGNIVLAEYGGKVGIGTTTPYSILELTGMVPDAYTASSFNNVPAITIKQENADTNYGGIRFTNTAGNFEHFFGAVQTSTNTADMVFQGYDRPSGVYKEFMRVSQTGDVGIGTSLPSHKLEIRNDVAATTDLDRTSIKLYNNSDGGSAIEFSNAVLGKSKISFGVQSTGAGTNDSYLGFSTGQDGGLTERMRIDAGGSVLIGKTTPIDLHNTWNHIIIGEKGAIISENGAGGIDGITLADNAYIDADTGTYAYQTNGAASLIRQSGGVTQFSNAASGSAGDGLTPVQTMAINADRKVDVGGIANQTVAVLNARFNGAAIEFGHGNNGAGYYGTAGSYGNNGQPYIGFSCYSQENVNVFTTTGAKGNIITGDLSGNLTFAQITTATGTGLSPENRMTLLADGKFGIGITDPTSLLHVQSNDATINTFVDMLTLTALSTGTTTTGFGPAIKFQAERNNGVMQNVGRIRSVAEVNLGTDISSGLAFETSAVGVADEKVRISYDGKVGIGTTNPLEKLYVNSTSGDARIGLNAPSESDAEIKFSNNGTVEYTIGHDDATDNFVIGGTNVDAPLVSVTKAGDTLVSGEIVMNSRNAFKQGGGGQFKTIVISGGSHNTLKGVTTQAKSYLLATIGFDYANWNGNQGIFEVELHDEYYSDGIKKRYVISAGYQNTGTVELVERVGQGNDLAKVRIVSSTNSGGGGSDPRKCQVWVDVGPYATYAAVIRTTRYFGASPVITGQVYLSSVSEMDATNALNITFTADTETVQLSTSPNVGISGNLTTTGTISSGAITSTGDINLTSTATTSPSVTFNSNTAADPGVDMAIRLDTAEGLSFYEPEDTNKVHFKILDDIGVDAPYGYLVNGVRIISSGGIVTADDVTSTNGSKILAGRYSTGYITTLGSGFSDGGPVLGYAVWPSTSAANSFISSSGAATLQRAAFQLDGNNFKWYSGAGQTVAEGSPVSTSLRMQLDASGNLGIGGSPTAPLHVFGGGILGSSSTNPIAFTGSGGANAGIGSYNANTDFCLYSAGTGSIRFRTAATWNSAAQLTSIGTDRMQLTSGGNLIVAGNITAYGSPSDIRLKENIEVIPNAVDKVKTLDGITFNYIKDGADKRMTGVIAQQVQEVLPEAVYETETIEDPEDKNLAVHYGNMVGLLIEAIKEQQQQIDELKSIIEGM